MCPKAAVTYHDVARRYIDPQKAVSGSQLRAETGRGCVPLRLWLRGAVSPEKAPIFFLIHIERFIIHVRDTQTNKTL